MRITAAVAEQLQLLHADPDRADRFAARLSRLGRDVALAVPSCLAVTISLARQGSEVSVSMITGVQPAAVLASLAVPLSAVAPRDLLVLRAGAAGAFLLLADDLDGRPGPGHPSIEVDKHLSWPPAPSGESSAASLADLRVVDQAMGVLVDRGLPPEAAGRDLQRRAGAADMAVAAVSRALLASLRPGPGRG